MNVSLLLLVASIGQSDPPRIEQPDPPKLARRVAELEGRVQRLETALGIASFPAAKSADTVIVPASATTYTYSTTQTCTGPNCGQATQAEGWYLGKNLGRKK